MATPIRNSKLYPDLPPVVSGAKRRVVTDDKENLAQDVSIGIKKQKVYIVVEGECMYIYSETPHCGHPSNLDTCFCPKYILYILLCIN